MTREQRVNLQYYSAIAMLVCDVSHVTKQRIEGVDSSLICVVLTFFRSAISMLSDCKQKGIGHAHGLKHTSKQKETGHIFKRWALNGTLFPYLCFYKMLYNINALLFAQFYA